MLTDTLISFLIVLLFLNDKFLIRNFKFFKFFFCFIPFYLKNIYFIGTNYFKFTYKIIKILFVVSFLPAFFQYSLIFHYFFNVIWDGFLLLCINFLLFSFPFYCYSFFTTQKIDYPNDARYFLLLLLLVFLNWENSISLIMVLVSFEISQIDLLKR
jgi:hypothetical protein